MRETEWVFSFHTTGDAILAEQALMQAGLAPRVMPLPSAIRAGCGLCLRVATAQKDAALHALEQRRIRHAGLYLRYPQGEGSRYEEAEK